MKFGVCVSNYGATASVEGMRRVSAECQSLGYDSIWVTDHLLMQRNSGTPYGTILESLTSAAFLAATLRRVRVGISVLIIPMRNPVLVAKQLATIDRLSGGRLILGVGAGWNEREFKNLGADFHTRGKRLDESIRLIRTLWSGKTSFMSRSLELKFRGISFEPSPVQEKLPIWVGGISPAAMKRALKFGDAWHPGAYSLSKTERFIRQFKSLAGSNKFPICLRIGLDAKSGSIHGRFRRTKTLQFCGDMGRNEWLMEKLRLMGVSYMLLTPDNRGITKIETQIDALRKFAKKFLRR